MSFQEMAFSGVANELIDAHFNAGNPIRFTISTSSMSPLLMPGDQIIVVPTSPETLRAGDLVLVRASGFWLAHRLIGKRIQNRKTRWITKGDNCSLADQIWSTDEMCGIITAVRTSFGCINLRSWWTKTTGLALAWL
jgi:signal peptidase I